MCDCKLNDSGPVNRKEDSKAAACTKAEELQPKCNPVHARYGVRGGWGGRVGPGAKNPGSRLQPLCMAHYINLPKPQFPQPPGAMHSLFPIAT